MKDSGIEWVGEIPEDWDVVKLKYIAEARTGNSIKDDEKELYEDSKEAIPYISTKDINVNSNKIDYENGMYTKKNDSSFRVAQKNSILMCIEGGSAGRKIAFTDRDVSHINKLCNFDSFKSSNKFIYYYMQSPSFLEEFRLNMSGLIGGVSVSSLKQFEIPYPELEHQQKIANFLDKKVAEIDHILDKTRESIEEYMKYKQSIITEAVTKGLNPNAEMKGSGIEWIGEIPKHWKVRKLRYLGTLQNGISKSGDDFGFGYPFISYGDVYKNYSLPLRVEGLVNSTEKDRDTYSVKKGDVFFTRTSETIEEVGFAATCLDNIENAVFAGFVIRFRPNKHDLAENFSKYYFRSEMHRRFFVKEMNLVTRASLSQELLKKLPVIIPPIKEQQEIADYINKQCTEIDSLISQKETLLKDLEVYKKSLIFECVTGKREVGNEQ